MAQLFKPSANTMARTSLLVMGALPVLAILVGMTLARGSMNTRVGNMPEQPVPFSHRHHATELGIDCRYCHTGVESSPQAGLPSTETCMTCHSQIWQDSPLLEPARESYAQDRAIKWVQVNKVPEFVYFNHAIHVNKGVSCNNCHGPVQNQQMSFKSRTFFMSWCLKCHKDPAKYMWQDKEHPNLSPREQVFNLYKKYQADPSMAGSSPAERSLALGNEQVNPDRAEGESILKMRGIQKPQMADCWTCHR